MDSVNVSLGSSLPLDLARGFAIFPTLGTARAGTYTTSGNQPNDTLLTIEEQPANFGAWQVLGFVNGGFYAGFIGPAYALAMQLQGELRRPGDYNNPASLQTRVVRDYEMAGLVIGLGFMLDFNLNFSVPDTSLNYTFQQGVNVDLLQLLAALLIGKLGSEAFQRTAETLPGASSSWAFLDSTENIFTPANGSNFDLRPVLSFPINLVPLLVLLPVVGDALEGVLTGMREIGADLLFGPVLGLGIELHGELEQIAGFGYGATDFYPYASGEFFGADFTQADPTVPADQVTISVTHSATLTMSIGIYAQLTFLQLINVEQEYDWDVTSLVGLGHPGQAYRDTALTGTNGQTPPITLAPTVVFELA